MATTDMHATTEELLKAVFSVWSVMRLYNRASCHYKRALRRQLEEEEVGVRWPPA
jgi:hypothetical protein